MYHFSWVQLAEPLIHALDVFLQSQGMTESAAHTGAIVVLSSWVVALGLIGAALLARRGLDRARARDPQERFVSDGTLTIRNFFEIFTEGLLNLSMSALDRTHAVRYFPLIAGLFIYIFFSNLWAIVPGGLPPTDNLNNNAGMAIIVFLVFNWVGIRSQGLGYFKHMGGPVWWLAPLIFVIELVGLFIRPVSLTLRLMGNMYGDHTVFGVMTDMVPILVPSIFLGLGIFVCFLQAFVFTLLSVIYIALSLPQHDH